MEPELYLVQLEGVKLAALFGLDYNETLTVFREGPYVFCESLEFVPLGQNKPQ